MKIYCITANPRINKEQLRTLKSLGDFKVINASKLSTKEIISKAHDAEILVVGSSGVEGITEELLKGLKKLKFITTLTVGMAWVDLEAAKRLKIPVSNIKGSNSESVAEHAWGMILDLAKRITEFDRDVRNKGAYKFGEYQGKEVYGKTIGIIGLGDIGKKVARIAKAFNMEVLGVNKSGKKVAGVKLTTLNKLLKQSDVIVVAVPLTKETENMISKAELRLIKQGAILVNTAMEPIVNKKAALIALKKGKLYGYGIETDIMKPIPKNDPYLIPSRLVVTPHNAFNTEDAERLSFDVSIENIKSFFKGKPSNRVV
jgi:D-3-phosphoglycerate dehydrogenase